MTSPHDSISPPQQLIRHEHGKKPDPLRLHRRFGRSESDPRRRPESREEGGEVRLLLTGLSGGGWRGSCQSCSGGENRSTGRRDGAQRSMTCEKRSHSAALTRPACRSELYQTAATSYNCYINNNNLRLLSLIFLLTSTRYYFFCTASFFLYFI